MPAKTTNITPKTRQSAPIHRHNLPQRPAQMNGNERDFPIIPIIPSQYPILPILCIDVKDVPLPESIVLNLLHWAWNDRYRAFLRWDLPA